MTTGTITATAINRPPRSLETDLAALPRVLAHMEKAVGELFIIQGKMSWRSFVVPATDEERRIILGQALLALHEDGQHIEAHSSWEHDL